MVVALVPEDLRLARQQLRRLLDGRVEAALGEQRRRCGRRAPARSAAAAARRAPAPARARRAGRSRRRGRPRRAPGRCRRRAPRSSARGWRRRGGAPPRWSAARRRSPRRARWSAAPGRRGRPRSRPPGRRGSRRGRPPRAPRRAALGRARARAAGPEAGREGLEAEGAHDPAGSLRVSGDSIQLRSTAARVLAAAGDDVAQPLDLGDGLRRQVEDVAARAAPAPMARRLGGRARAGRSARRARAPAGGWSSGAARRRSAPARSPPSTPSWASRAPFAARKPAPPRSTSAPCSGGRVNCSDSIVTVSPRSASKPIADCTSWRSVSISSAGPRRPGLAAVGVGARRCRRP